MAIIQEELIYNIVLFFKSLKKNLSLMEKPIKAMWKLQECGRIMNSTKRQETRCWCAAGFLAILGNVEF